MPPGADRQQLDRDAWMAQVMGDIDPANYAGEGFTATDEVARPSDILDPYVRGKVEDEEGYWPGRSRRRK